MNIYCAPLQVRYPGRVNSESIGIRKKDTAIIVARERLCISSKTRQNTLVFVLRAVVLILRGMMRLKRGIVIPCSISSVIKHMAK